MATPDAINHLFTPITAGVEKFAADHRLAIEKCERGNQGWELIRPHPDGGEYRLLLMYDETLGLGVGAVWHFSCEEMDRIYYHFRQMASCPIEADKVVSALGEELAALGRVRFGYWTHMQPLNPPDPQPQSESGRRADRSARPPHHVACGSALRGSTERSTLDPE